MTFQDEFARRNARGAGTGDGGDPDKPLLFRGGVGVVAMRQHRSRQRMGVVRGGMDWKRKGGAQTRDTTPTPPLKRRGLRRESIIVILNLFQDLSRQNRKMVARRTRS